MDTINSYVGSFIVAYPSLQRLVHAFCACLKGPSLSPQAVARAWIVWGALQMHCAFPASPLDPIIVNALKIAITQAEVSRLFSNVLFHSMHDRDLIHLVFVISNGLKNHKIGLRAK